MALDPKLLEILACPKDKGPLLYFADEESLYNPRLGCATGSPTTSRSCWSTRPRRSTTPSTSGSLAKAPADGITPTFDPEA